MNIEPINTLYINFEERILDINGKRIEDTIVVSLPDDEGWDT